MKKLLASTAVVAALSFGSAASAQPPAQSLLDNLLGEVSTLQVGLVNSAENYADVGSVVDIELDSEDMAETILDALLDGNGTEITIAGELVDIDGLLGRFSVSGAAQPGSFAGEAVFFDPSDLVTALATLTNNTNIKISDVASTAIGALNTGTIGNMSAAGDITAMTVGLTAAAESVSEAVAGTAKATAGFSPVTGPVLMANLALNGADSVGSNINIYTSGLVNVDAIAGTAIGALNTGNIAADLTASIVGNGSNVVRW